MSDDLRERVARADLKIANKIRDEINEILSRYDIPSDVYQQDVRIDAACVMLAAAALRQDDGQENRMSDEIAMIAREVAAEVRRAEEKHAPLNSPHEAWSVIYEELEELREHVRADTGRDAAARKEAIQVAAMGLRYVLNLCAEQEARKDD